MESECAKYQFNPQTRDKQKTYNTLLCMVKMMCGNNILIDLQNECAVAGHLDDVDANNFLHISNGIMIRMTGANYDFDVMFINFRSVRYVHLPDKMNVADEIQRFLVQSKRKKLKPDKPRGLKQTRALKRHQQTVAELAQNTK